MRWRELLASPAFRPYPSEDLAGVELAGALKNVIAIAAGVTMGKGLGENARAALIARGLAEMTRLALAQGARRETLMGLAGLGDLILTATSLTSRNTSFGHALAQGSDPARLLARGGSAKALTPPRPRAGSGGRAGVELPIAEAVRAVVAGELGWTRRSTDCSRGRCRSASDDQARPSSRACSIQCSRSTRPGNSIASLTRFTSSGVRAAIWPKLGIPSSCSFFSITLPMPRIAVRSSAAGLAGAGRLRRDRLGSGRLDRRLGPGQPILQFRHELALLHLLLDRLLGGALGLGELGLERPGPGLGRAVLHLLRDQAVLGLAERCIGLPQLLLEHREPGVEVGLSLLRLVAAVALEQVPGETDAHQHAEDEQTHFHRDLPDRGHRPACAAFCPLAPCLTTLQAVPISSAAFSAIMITGALVLPEVMLGMIEASAMRRPSMPRTSRRSSTTAVRSPSGPILQVPTGWKMVVPISPAARTRSASLCSSAPGRYSLGANAGEGGCGGDPPGEPDRVRRDPAVFVRRQVVRPDRGHGAGLGRGGAHLAAAGRAAGCRPRR